MPTLYQQPQTDSGSKKKPVVDYRNHGDPVADAKRFIEAQKPDPTEKKYQNAVKLADERRADNGGNLDFLKPERVADDQSNDADYRRGREAAERVSNEAGNRARGALSNVASDVIDGLVERGFNSLPDTHTKDVAERTRESLYNIGDNLANVDKPLIDTIMEGPSIFEAALAALTDAAEAVEGLLGTKESQPAQVRDFTKEISPGDYRRKTQRGGCPLDASSARDSSKCGKRSAQSRGPTPLYD